MQVIIDGLLTEYNQYGMGNSPTVLILHGWGDDSRSWHNFATKLAESYRVLVPDLPGFGGTQAPPSPWSLTEYAQFVRTFTDKLSVQPSLIIGHSNGGAIAIHALATERLCADKLVLLASAGIRDNAKGKKRLLKLIARTGKAVTLVLPSGTTRRLKQRFYGSIGSDLLVAEHMQETFKRVVGQDVQADAANLKLPVFLIYGEADAATPVLYGQQFHELITGSILEVLPGVGHFVHLEAPDKVIEALRTFQS